MSTAVPVRPDTDFIRRVLGAGGEDLKQCFQCATCSVVCELADGTTPFPRKEMIWAQWGLKDRLVADPDIWRCHQCNDCSTRCPRGARPGDVLAALRQQSVEHHAVPRFLGRWVNQVRYLPLMLLIPVVLLLLALAVKEPLANAGPLKEILHFLDHEGFYAELYPHWLLIGFYSLFIGLAFLGAAFGLVRFWRSMKAADQAAGRYAPTMGVVPSLLRALVPVFSHDKFGKCVSQRSRRLAHLGAFYGFVALFVVSLWAVVALYLINPFIENHQNHIAYPFGLLNPWKLLANAGGIALAVGCIVAIRNRMTRKELAGASTAFDWIFVWLLLVVAVTGLLAEGLRLVAEGPSGAGGLRHIAYPVYFLHLVVVFGLLVYLPYSKFAHVLYRTVALAYAEHSGRNGPDVQKA